MRAMGQYIMTGGRYYDSPKYPDKKIDEIHKRV